MIFPHVGISLTIDQVVEFQVAFLEQVVDVLAVEIAQVQNSDFALEACHVVDDVLGLYLAESEFVFVDIELFHHLHEGLDREGIMLRRNGELLLLLHGLVVTATESLVMVIQLVRLGHEFLAVRRKRHAAARAVENHDADLFFEVADSGRQRRLRNKQVLGSLVKGAHLGDTDYIAELLQSHGS